MWSVLTSCCGGYGLTSWCGGVVDLASPIGVVNQVSSIDMVSRCNLAFGGTFWLSAHIYLQTNFGLQWDSS